MQLDNDDDKCTSDLDEGLTPGTMVNANSTLHIPKVYDL